MKKLFALLLALVLVLSLAACGGGNGDKPPDGGNDSPGTSQQEQDESTKDNSTPEGVDAEFTIYVNGSEEWTPFPGKSGVTFSLADENLISASDNGKKISFTGKQVGETVITAILDSSECKALVRVREMESEINIDYAYNPPKDNYYFRLEDRVTGEAEAYGRIGAIYAEYFEDYERHYYYDDNEQLEYEYDAAKQSWQMIMNDKNEAAAWYKDFQEGKATNAANHDTETVIAQFETIFMRYFRQYGLDESRLVEHYVGTETVLGVECWVFDGKGLNSIDDKYWVDPSNGCTLKVESTDGSVWQLTHYNLNYTEWSTDLMP